MDFGWKEIDTGILDIHNDHITIYIANIKEFDIIILVNEDVVKDSNIYNNKYLKEILKVEKKLKLKKNNLFLVTNKFDFITDEKLFISSIKKIYEKIAGDLVYE